MDNIVINARFSAFVPKKNLVWKGLLPAYTYQIDTEVNRGQMISNHSCCPTEAGTGREEPRITATMYGWFQQNLIDSRGE